MMTDKELTEVAEEIVGDMLAIDAIKQQEQARLRILKDGVCPCCKIGTPRSSAVQGVKRCPNCRAYFGDKFDFQFPLWAQNKKRFFRRCFCLVFNIQLKVAANAPAYVVR